MSSPENFKLIVQEGPSPGQQFELTRSEIVLGRDPGVELSLPSPVVSRRHARLLRQGDAYLLEDLGSSNGTYLNGQKIGSERLRLTSGDRIGLGQAILLLYQAPEPGSTAR